MALDILVVAGAGSGKTRVLVNRVLELMKRGVSPSQMLVLTFTRKAAAEMRGRLERAIEGNERFQSQLKTAMIGTFHAVALRILHASGDKLGYNAATLEVIDADDSRMLLLNVADELGYRNGKAWKGKLSEEKVTRALDAFYNTGDVPPRHEVGCFQIMREYKQRLFAMNIVDFGTILQAVNDLFLMFPETLATYRKSIRVVLVDELQDADAVQYRLHDWFSGGEGAASFFGVGDLRQTIYGFRGARPDLMHASHPQAEQHYLAECFRCGDAIVEFANRIISKAPNLNVAPMVGATGRIGSVYVMTGRTADIVQAVIESNADDGYAWSDIAVMARSHKELKRLAAIMHETGIPHYRVGSGFDICETETFRRVHAMLRLTVNTRDDLAYMRMMVGVDPADYAALKKGAAEAGVSHFEFRVSKARHRADGELMALNARIREGDRISVNDALDVFTYTGEAFRCATWWRERYGSTEIREALSAFAMRNAHDDLTIGNKVTLLTAHAAKGLEWPCVIIANCNEGTFPNSRAVREGSVNEERRLMYVAMTRARERLVLHYRRPEDQSEDGKISPPSRFLKESGLLGETHGGEKAAVDGDAKGVG